MKLERNEFVEMKLKNFESKSKLLKTLERNFKKTWAKTDEEIINSWSFRENIQLHDDLVFDKLFYIHFKPEKKEKEMNKKEKRLHYYALSKWGEMHDRKMDKATYEFILNTSREEMLNKIGKEKRWNYKNSMYAEWKKGAKGWGPLL